jgi:anaerobic ribonucleoside-triphosphate reductase activating protein
MKIMNIMQDSIVDGTGLRTVIFFAGCSHFCKGCHNPLSWNIRNGSEWSLEDVLVEVKSNPIANVTFSGGDPFYQPKEVAALAREIKKLGKTIWAYTGYTYQEALDNPELKELLDEVDVLVDGRFELGLKDLSLKFRGSSNQRIIDVKTGLDLEL